MRDGSAKLNMMVKEFKARKLAEEIATQYRHAEAGFPDRKMKLEIFALANTTVTETSFADNDTWSPHYRDRMKQLFESEGYFTKMVGNKFVVSWSDEDCAKVGQVL